MDVSVIILNYNTFELTCSCIRSVLSKTRGCSYEVILVDNASTERDPGEFVRLFPQIKLVRNEINAGFAKGNNMGIEMAAGEAVLLLNSDTELANDAVSICLETLRKDRRTAVVGCLLTFPDGSVQHNCQRFPAIRYRLFELLRLQKLLPSRLAGKILLGFFFDHRSAVFPDWIWGTFFMFRRELLQQLPQRKLADDFFMYVEDMQWCMDFKRLGYRISFEPRGHVFHHLGKSNGRKSHLMEAHTEQFMRRHYSSWRRSLIGILDRWLQRSL